MSKYAYYDSRVSGLDTAAYVRERGATSPAELCAAWRGADFTQAELTTILNEDADHAIVASVEDNGAGGDGVLLAFHAANRKWNDHAEDLFAVVLTPGQARLFAEALLSAVRLRAAETDAHALDKAKP